MSKPIRPSPISLRISAAAADALKAIQKTTKLNTTDAICEALIAQAAINPNIKNRPTLSMEDYNYALERLDAAHRFLAQAKEELGEVKNTFKRAKK